MALYVEADYGNGYAEAATAVDPLDELRARHKELSHSYHTTRGELLDLLRKDCERLERECKIMADTMAVLRRDYPMTGAVYR